jgi:hypothetical protein
MRRYIEKHILEDLRDKEKREVDFLTVIDKIPVQMIEVKASDDNFSKSLFRFHNFLKEATPIQIVYNLKSKKSRGSAKMLPVHEFLANL